MNSVTYRSLLDVVMVACFIGMTYGIADSLNMIYGPAGIIGGIVISFIPGINLITAVVLAFSTETFTSIYVAAAVIFFVMCNFKLFVSD